MKKIILLFILLVNFLSAEFSFGDMFKDMKDAASSMNQDAKDSVASMKDDAVETSKSTDRTVIVDDNLKTTKLHSKSELKQRNLQLKKIKSQIWILNKEIDNLVNENHLITSKIDVKKNKIVAIKQQADYQIDTYLEQISNSLKNDIVNDINAEESIQRYRKEAKAYKKNTENEVLKLDKEIEALQHKLKINQKKLKRYSVSKDEKVKLIKYYENSN